jgi:hypothetical protein
VAVEALRENGVESAEDILAEFGAKRTIEGVIWAIENRPAMPTDFPGYIVEAIRHGRKGLRDPLEGRETRKITLWERYAKARKLLEGMKRREPGSRWLRE